MIMVKCWGEGNSAIFHLDLSLFMGVYVWSVTLTNVSFCVASPQVRQEAFEGWNEVNALHSQLWDMSLLKFFPWRLDLYYGEGSDCFSQRLLFLLLPLPEQQGIFLRSSS